MEAKVTATTKWTIDPVHSEIAFRVKHLMVSTVRGKFREFSAELETDNDHFEDARITFEADAASIDTGVKQRDAHLRSDDFFNAEQFPKITFRSREFKQVRDNEYRLVGDFTIRDVTKTIELKVLYGGTMVDHTGQTKAGFEISGAINRKDFGLKWSAVTEAGGAVVSDEVKLDLQVQLLRVT